MEAYFHSDSRIEEWVDQITEKIFTVCLLTGVDAEAEFQKGCEIVAKVTQLLQGISIFPSEYLEDGLKQILEQQLPDSRVITNFPTFQDTMNKMLHEGMMMAMDTQTKEDLSPLAATKKCSAGDTNDAPKEEVGEKSIVLLDQQIEKIEEVFKEVFKEEINEYANEQVIAALASVQSIPSKDNTTMNELLLVPSNPEKPYGIMRKTQVPDQADRLKYVINSIFPNIPICWNLNLMGQNFLAQVEDLLICLDNPEKPCQVETFNDEGWKVYVCDVDDLMFPRRLERGIRQIQRSVKTCKKV